MKSKRLISVLIVSATLLGLLLQFRASDDDPDLDADVAAPVENGSSSKSESLGQNQSTSKVTNSETADQSESGEVVPVTPGLAADRLDATLGLDPSKVGWQSEAFSEAASKHLGRLAKLMASSEQLSYAELEKLVAAGFRCDLLAPTALTDVFGDSSVRVSRYADSDATETAEVAGVDGLVRAIQSLPQSENGRSAYAKFKVISVEFQSDTARTEVLAEGAGRNVDGAFQWKATWNCLWSAKSEKTPKLLQIKVQEYEQTKLLGGDKWLVDITSSVLGDNESYREQLAFGMEYWLRRLEGRLGTSRLGHNGIAVGDVNGDGRDDLYVCQSGGLPNLLFIAQEDGTSVETAAAAGVDYLDDSTCALVVDLNNDGHQDLVLMTISGGLVFSGDSSGQFTLRSALPDCRNAFSLTAADYDNDSFLDLYVGRYWPTAENRGDIPIPVPYYDAKNGGRNLLLRNVGDWKFEDVTQAAGLDFDNTRYTMASAWDDIDQDGDADLYVANDFGRNCLYRNDGGVFTNIASELGVEDAASGMSVTFADYDHDGHSDIYISNMFSSAGNRVTYQRQYAEQFDSDDVRSFQRMARGNTLFRRATEDKFEDVSEAMGVTMGRWAWGSLFADLNNDSWDDLLVLNGNITAEDSGDL